MMERFIESCCGECTHTRSTPCDRFIECRLTGPLCHESSDCRAAREALIERFAHSPAFREH